MCILEAFLAFTTESSTFIQLWHHDYNHANSSKQKFDLSAISQIPYCGLKLKLILHSSTQQINQNSIQCQSKIRLLQQSKFRDKINIRIMVALVSICYTWLTSNTQMCPSTSWLVFHKCKVMELSFIETIHLFPIPDIHVNYLYNGVADQNN